MSLRMRNVSDKSCKENRNTVYVHEIPPLESSAVYENLEKYGRTRHAKDANI